MKRILLFILALCLISGCTSTVNEAAEANINSTAVAAPTNNVSNEFNFIFSFGVGGKNVLNTFEGTFTKDLVALGTETAKLRLSAEEMDRICSMMKEVDIFSYPDTYKLEPVDGKITLVTPCELYYLKVHMDGKDKTISWEDENMEDSKKANALRNLFKQIEKMIYEKKEYKEMSPASGGYD